MAAIFDALTDEDRRMTNHVNKNLKEQLSERIKEQRCFNDIFYSVSNLDTPIPELLQTIVNLLPKGWMYPEVTAARIVVEDRCYDTINFREGFAQLTALIELDGYCYGSVCITYLEAKPEQQEGLFLYEESVLLDAVALLIARILKRISLNKELALEYEEKAIRAEELKIANKKLAFQQEEKAKRAAELVILTTLKQEKNNQTAELLIVNQKLRLSIFETITLARQLGEMRDPYTAGHEEHVGDLAAAISVEMGLTKEFQEGIRVAGYLHDVGKIIIPAEILCKPTKLSFEEFALIKTHVMAGYEVVKNISFPWEVARPILEHHEKLDGSGYPNGLKGDEISLNGRILAVADALDAMSTHRPYRPALGLFFAVTEIERCAGTYYDPQVVEVCARLFKEKMITVYHDYAKVIYPLGHK
jgi:putative nucleotidyltransferase with HDIG domain